MLSFSNLSAGLVAALLVSQTSAHFLMNYPESIGFSDDSEGTGPCGSFTVDFATDPVTEFHVGGDTIALRSTHPDTKWLFRATLGSADAGNWTALSQVIQQSALGSFCRSDIVVPESFAGQNGTLGVAANGPDGILYQCAAVSFVAGAATSVPSACTNSSGVAGSYTDDSTLTALLTTTTSTDNTTSTDPSATSSGTSAATSSSAANANALVGYSYSGLGSLAWIGVVGSATFLACLL
ncbi:hypothetical protein IFR04_003901 [Cadophora malorum]|uniref:Copper acquisition factor BIM1-like domain-containing protein n=1 Tax=Cadophora malorum TaxID=108018 RepID=A0A8H7WDU3_9HELO|nr:hypothetical protein IFR04_003901 [Cadophora malorum]